MLAYLFAASIAFAGDPMEALSDYYCNEPIRQEWVYVEGPEGEIAFEDTSEKRFVGKVDRTLIIPSPWGSTAGVVFLLDTEDRRWKRRHARRVWKWLNKRFGPPTDDEPIWAWTFSEGEEILFGSTGDGFAVVFTCAPFDPRDQWRRMY